MLDENFVSMISADPVVNDLDRQEISEALLESGATVWTDKNGVPYVAMDGESLLADVDSTACIPITDAVVESLNHALAAHTGFWFPLSILNKVVRHLASSNRTTT